MTSSIHSNDTEYSLFAEKDSAYESAKNYIKDRVRWHDLQDEDTNYHEDFFDQLSEAIQSNDYNDMVSIYNDWMSELQNDDPDGVVFVSVSRDKIKGAVCNCNDCGGFSSAKPIENKTIKPLSYPNGMNCSICNDHNQYAEPNQPDGTTYTCYACDKLPKLMLG